MSNVNKQKKGTTSRESKPDANHPHTTIWETIDEIMSDVPEEILNRLPPDGAERHDHYLRGEPVEVLQKS